MTLCKDCKHFRQHIEHWLPPQRGACLRWLTGYGVNLNAISDNEVVVEDDEGWGMDVGPEFGCVLSEPLGN